MILKYDKFVNENYDTGYFNYNGRSFKLDVDNSGRFTKVKILYMDKYYEDLSIVIPDSKKLDNEEFFVNPKIEKGMIEELEKEGFIECTDIESMAGDLETKSYKLV